MMSGLSLIFSCLSFLFHLPATSTISTYRLTHTLHDRLPTVPRTQIPSRIHPQALRATENLRIQRLNPSHLYGDPEVKAVVSSSFGFVSRVSAVAIGTARPARSALCVDRLASPSWGCEPGQGSSEERRGGTQRVTWCGTPRSR